VVAATLTVGKSIYSHNGVNTTPAPRPTIPAKNPAYRALKYYMKNKLLNACFFNNFFIENFS